MIDHLRVAGHAVDHAAKLDAAMAAARSTDDAHILLDLALPDGDGLGLLRDRAAMALP